MLHNQGYTISTKPYENVSVTYIKVLYNMGIHVIPKEKSNIFFISLCCCSTFLENDHSMKIFFIDKLLFYKTLPLLIKQRPRAETWAKKC